MTTTKTLMIVAMSLLPALAHARDFGSPGVLEMGGTFELSNGSSTVKPKGGSKSTDNTSELAIRPEFGFFAGRKLELLGGVVIASSSASGDSGKSSSSTFGIRMGGDYLLDVGFAHMGPQVRIGYDTTSGKSGGTDYELAGPAAEAGFVAKIQFAEGGIFTVGLGAGVSPQKYTLGDADPVDYTTTSFGIKTGFSAYF